MKRRIIGAIAVILMLAAYMPAFSQSNDTTKYVYYRYSYGNRMARYWADSVLTIPKDTSYSKEGIARIGNALYVGNGTLWTAAGGTTASLSGDTLFIGSDTLLLTKSFADITGDAFDNTNLYGYFYYRGLPKYATTGDLAAVNVTVSDKVIVEGTGILEWSATGPADGVTYFAGLGGFWKVISRSGKNLTYKNGIRLDGDTVKLDNLGTPADGQQIAVNAGNYDLSLNGNYSALHSKWHSYFMAYDSLYAEVFANEFQVSALMRIGGYYYDADVTLPTSLDAKSGIFLDTITANRTITFAAPPALIGNNKNGTLLYILNTNNSAFTWNTAGVTVEDGQGTALTTIDRGFWLFMWDGEKWIRQAGGSASSTSSSTNVYVENGAPSTDLDTIATKVNDSTLLFKALGVIGGTFINVTKEVGADSAKWTPALDTSSAALKDYIAANSGGGGGSQTLDQVLNTGNQLTTDRSIDINNNTLTLDKGTASIGAPITTSEVGVMWSDDFNRASLGSDWTEVTPTATVTLNSSVMQVSSGGSFTDYITYKDTTGVSRWTLESELVTSADGNGYGFGLKSIGSNDWSLLFRLIMTGADKGKIRVYWDDAEVGGVISTSSTGYSYINGDTLQLKLFRDDDTVNITVKKKSGIDSLVYSIPYYPGVLGASLMHNTAKVRMYFYGGTYEVNNFSYAINEHKNSFAFVGNSITTGYRATTPKYRWVNRVFANRDRFNIVGGPGDFTSSAASLTKDLDSLNPSHIVYAMGVNDARAGVSTATFSTNVQVIANYAQANSKELVFVGLVPANTVDVRPYNDTLQAIATRYGARYVDIYSSLVKTGTTTWNPIYANADSIHPNDEGHRLIGDLVSSALTEISKLYLYEAALEVTPDYDVVLKDNKVFLYEHSAQVDLTPATQQTGEVWVTDVLTDSLEVGTMPSGMVKGTVTIGAATTSASEYAIRAVNSSNTNLFTVKNDGTWFGAPIAELSTTRLRFAGASQQITATNTTTQTTAPVNFTPTTQFRGIAGAQQNHIRVAATFDPTSGTSPFSEILIATTINQTGGASGVTRGVHIAPTLTSAADYRAIEVITGKSYLRSVHLSTAGDKLNIATGSNASTGQATMVGGTVTVTTTAVTASSLIYLTVAIPGGTQGFLAVGTITAGTSFVINSTSATETSVVNWWIIN